ncbi:MAG: MerR family transcriptional regulator [Acidobacteriota bacterium]|nr:MerR family transcriptional regulator [Blastocatellia bacterium]MDW8240547.1 MerR family transcriptional regulator [Acidobacteriota bacterium]
MQAVNANVIPDKLFFKIGEVCELADVQPHVLRYWETEFPQLAPQKNRAGQRVYRRRDVELVLYIKRLLKEEGYTIAGAKKKLSQGMRAGTRLTVITNETTQLDHESARAEASSAETAPLSAEALQAIARIRRELEHLLTMLKQSDINTP